MTHSAPSLPFPIYRVSPRIERYVLYDIGIVTWLRKTHNILGVLIGTLPQIPSQNVFLGLPLELQPEEARLLVEKGLAHVVDDMSSHEQMCQSDTDVLRRQLRESLRREGLKIAKDIEKKRQARSQQAREKFVVRGEGEGEGEVDNVDRENEKPEHLDETLFDSSHKQSATLLSPSSDLQPWAVTPTISRPLSHQHRNDTGNGLPAVRSSSYAIFKHLHQHGYFMTPGIRFGCQFSVYPGDPLRFHSHFLAIGADWDEEIDLLHLIGGGRLGTGVKKGWMIGGIEEELEKEKMGANKDTSTLDKGSQVRTFCIEWGGM